jgi:hypothetical protein
VGLVGMLRAALQSLVSKWEWWDQLFLFGGLALVLVVLLPIFIPKIKDWFDSSHDKVKSKSEVQIQSKDDIIQSITKSQQVVPSTPSQINLPEAFSPMIKKMSEDLAVSGKYPTFIKFVKNINGKEVEENEGITYPGFELYTGRKTLQFARPITQLLPDTTKEVWGLWHAGTAIYSFDIIKRANVTKLIFPHPKNPSIEFLAKSAGKNVSDIQLDICRNTRVALEKRQAQDAEQENPLPKNQRIEVRWYNNFIGNMITVGYPNNLHPTWILLEMFTPFVSLDDRPSIRLFDKPFGSLFNSLLDSYNKTWEISKPPTEEDIKKWLSGN